jgi:hypothetical protein
MELILATKEMYSNQVKLFAFNLTLLRPRSARAITLKAEYIRVCFDNLYNRMVKDFSQTFDEFESGYDPNHPTLFDPYQFIQEVSFTFMDNLQKAKTVLVQTQ